MIFVFMELIIMIMGDSSTQLARAFAQALAKIFGIFRS
jgi:hypothetical protein